MKVLKALIDEFNKIVTVGFGKAYDGYTNKEAAIVGSYKVPASSASQAVFGMFLDGLQKVTGTPIPSETLPEADKVVIPHDPYAKRVEIPEADFERAQTVADLDLYQAHVRGLAVLAKDFPIETALDMIDAGATTSMGKCFDGKALFANDHFYGEATGQDNLLSGSGTTAAQIAADLKSAISALEGFVYKSGNRYKKFNKNVKPLVICDVTKKGIFEDLLKQESIGGTTNTLRNSFEIVAEKLANASDWYVMDQDNGGVAVNAPIINPVEKEAKLENNIGQESQILDHILRYQVYLRGGFGYGAWWKIVKVDNA